MKAPWTVAGVPWRTEGAFWNWVRGILRKGWSRHPVKIEYIRKYRKRIINPVEKNRKRFPECWGMTCEICGVDHVQGNIEIDHKGDNCTFTGLKDSEGYIKHLFLVDFTSLRALCKACHKIVSHAQNEGITFEEARKEKDIISICKLPAKNLLAYLQEHGYNSSQVSNPAKRRLCVTEIINKEKANEVSI